MKECDKNQMRNPKTGRCVSRQGKIGRSVCDRIGMMQRIGTCWFNSVFNSFLLSERCYSFFLNKFDELSQEDKNKIKKQKTSNTCPTKLKKYDFYYYFYKYHHTKEISPHNAQQLINKLSIRSPEWEQERPGKHPGYALEKILPIIFNSEEYIYTYENYVGGRNYTSKIKFLFFAARWKIMKARRKFILDHAVIIVSCDGISHAISGYTCNNEYYIYDSNSTDTYKIDWRVRENIKKIMIVTHPSVFYNPTIYYAYICFIRK